MKMLYWSHLPFHCQTHALASLLSSPFCSSSYSFQILSSGCLLRKRSTFDHTRNISSPRCKICWSSCDISKTLGFGRCHPSSRTSPATVEHSPILAEFLLPSISLQHRRRLLRFYDPLFAGLGVPTYRRELSFEFHHLRPHREFGL